jgi:glycosyltransferase involved in cell wall biosynthesis
MRTAIVANTAWYLVNFRLNLIKALLDEGHVVVAVAPYDANHAAILCKTGVTFAPVAISGSGINPFRELLSILHLRKVLKQHRVNLVLSYTPKGNLYSALSALACGVPFVPNVSGLGRSFIRRNWVTRVVKLLYRLTLSRARRVFFQNLDDMAVFVEAGLVPRERCVRLPGSGVDLARFTLHPLPDRDPLQPAFLLVARLMWDKGVGEYANAARLVLKRYPLARFQLLGFLDVDNPSAVPRSQVEAWVEEGVLSYLGHTDDVRPFLMDADCVVLPSYREGVPRTLLEAAAMGRPVITTDAPGCRDTVVHGETGWLCRPGDAADLADKMLAYMETSPNERATMGRKGRARIETEFDERFVIDAYLRELRAMQPQ